MTRLPRHKKAQRKGRFLRAYRVMLAALERRPGEKYRVSDARNAKGSRIRPRFCFIGEPWKGPGGLFPLPLPGTFFDTSSGQKIVLGNWKESAVYSTITVGA